MDFWHDAAAQKRWLRRFALLTGLLLVPVFVLAVFARPSADDYIYAARTHAVIQQYGFDLPRLLKAAWDTNVYYYQNWQGLYVSGFTLAFQPAIFGNRFYGVTLLCVLLPLFFCLYGLARCVVLRLSAAQKRLPWALALLLTFAFIEGMPAPVEGLYWFNGAMNYLPYFSLAVLNAGLAFALCFAAQLTLRRKVLYAAAGCLCSLVIGGGHQVAGLLNLLLLLLAAVLCARRRNFWQLPAFAAAILGLLFNVLAPGTRVRTAGFSGAGFAEAVIKSFILAAMGARATAVRDALPAGAAGPAAAPPCPQCRSAGPCVPSSVFWRGSHLCADVGHDLPAVLHNGRHRRRTAFECRLDDLCAGAGCYRVSSARLA